MKTGLTLVELAQKVETQNESKRDFIVPMQSLKMDEVGQFDLGSSENKVEFTNHAHGQIADFLNIPRKYYETMRNGHSDLLQKNVNHWLNKSDEKRLIRTLDGKGRAFLSSRYRMMDNYDLMKAVIPALQGQNIRIESSEITEKKLYLKVVFPKTEGEIVKGDVVQSGILISNSEIGSGTITVQPLIYRLVCSNGLIRPDNLFKKYHLGKEFGMDDTNIREILSDETNRVSDAALWLQVRDVVKASFDTAYFEQYLNKLRTAAGVKIESPNIEKVVEVTRKKYGFGEDIGNNILRNLIEGKDLSQWGLVNAITATANTQTEYDMATELEETGGKIIELPKNEWKAISEAA